MAVRGCSSKPITNAQTAGRQAGRQTKECVSAARSTAHERVSGAVQSSSTATVQGSILTRFVIFTASTRDAARFKAQGGESQLQSPPPHLTPYSYVSSWCCSECNLQLYQHSEALALTDGTTLGKVDRQVEQQDLAQIVPHTTTLAHSSHDLHKAGQGGQGQQGTLECAL